MKLTVLQISVLEKLYDFLLEYPQSLILIPILWFVIMGLYRHFLGRLTPWIDGFCFIAATLATMGIVLLFI